MQNAKVIIPTLFYDDFLEIWVSNFIFSSFHSIFGLFSLYFFVYFAIFIELAATIPGALYKLCAIASIRFWVCVLAIPLYRVWVELNHRFMLPKVLSTLNLVFPINLLRNFCLSVNGFPFLALCKILLLIFLVLRISSFFSEA